MLRDQLTECGAKRDGCGRASRPTDGVQSLTDVIVLRDRPTECSGCGRASRPTDGVQCLTDVIVLRDRPTECSPRGGALPLALVVEVNELLHGYTCTVERFYVVRRWVLVEVGPTDVIVLLKPTDVGGHGCSRRLSVREELPLLEPSRTESDGCGRASRPTDGVQSSGRGTAPRTGRGMNFCTGAPAPWNVFMLSEDGY